MGNGGSTPRVIEDVVKHFSTLPEKVGKQCNSEGCWPVYEVSDMRQVIKNGPGKNIKTITTTVLDRGKAPFINNIIGIESNLHGDLEGSTLSLNDESLMEGFKEGGPNAAAMQKLSAESRAAKKKIKQIQQGVETTGQRAYVDIDRNVNSAETSSKIAMNARERAQLSAAQSGSLQQGAERAKNKAIHDAYIAEQKKIQAKKDQEDTEQSQKIARGDHKDIKSTLTSSGNMLEEVKKDHAITSAASEDAQGTAQLASAILQDTIIERQEQAANNVLAMPGLEVGMGSAVLSGQSRQSDADGKKIANIHKTLENIGIGSDVPESFIPGRKNKMEPFSLMEGFKEGNLGGVTESHVAKAAANAVAVAHNQKANHDQQSILSARNREARAKHLSSELMQQRRNIAGEIFTDYLTTDKSTNVNDVYQRKKQDNIKKERLVQTRQYEMKIYNEYINIGKIVVIAFVLFVLAKVLNNKGIIGDSLTELFIALIIIITIIYLIWKLVWLGLRDPIDFDKTNQGYDRQYVKNMKGNKYPPKKYNLGFLTGTCSGDDCCSNGMDYDSAANKCIVRPAPPSDGFDNMAGSLVEEGFKASKNTIINEVLGSI